MTSIALYAVLFTRIIVIITRTLISEFNWIMLLYCYTSAHIDNKKNKEYINEY